MVKALESQGAKKVKFTSYPDLGHGGPFTRAFENPELYKWFLSHSRDQKPEGKIKAR